MDATAEIVAAAAELLRTGGARAVTTRAVAQAAGVQPPTIFRIFGDKDGLMEAVAEHVMAGYSADKTVKAAAEDGDPVDDLRAAWHAHLQFGLSNPEVFQLLTSPRRSSPAVVAGEEVLRARVSRVAAAGLLSVPEGRAVDMIRAAGTGAVLTLLSQPKADLDGLLEAVLASILTTNPAPPASDTVAVVNAFRAAMPDLPTLSDNERSLLTEWLDRSA
ncbi:TetR/AcrR family transcriptional regulator [Kribbella sp. NPDC056951]|uniref:TetR/AcrR family transcriptional regulator n=1 Tax=Kribbella sp. NPDC056951 TaxID=3345978 RepID=UPI00363BCA7B